MSSKYLKMAIVLFLVIGITSGNCFAKDNVKPAVTSKSKKQAEKPAASSKVDKGTNKPEASAKPTAALKEYKGTIKITKNKEGKIESVVLKVGTVTKSTYHITLDEMGNELGSKMSGKIITASGTIKKNKDGNWLTVTKYTREKTKAEARPKTSKTYTKKVTAKK